MSLLQQQATFHPSHPLVTRTQIKHPIKQVLAATIAALLGASTPLYAADLYR